MFPVDIIRLFRRAKVRKKLIGLEKICNKSYLKYPLIQPDLLFPP